ncbi:MAG: hypothetical protein ACKVQC_11205 [Elusimicrobiota bacterium]
MYKKYFMMLMFLFFPLRCFSGYYEDYLKALHHRTFLEAFQIAKNISTDIPYDFFWKFQPIEINNRVQLLTQEDYLSYIEKLYMEGVKSYLAQSWDQARQKWGQVKLLKEQQGGELNQLQWNELYKYDFLAAQFIPKEILFTNPEEVKDVEQKVSHLGDKTKEKKVLMLISPDSKNFKKRRLNELLLKAQIAYEDGDWAMSRLWFERLLKLEPENKSVQNKLLELQQKTN